MLSKASLSGSVIDTVTKTENLRIVLVECHGDDTPLIFHDTPLFSLLILLVYFSKFNVHDTPMILPLKLALALKLMEGVTNMAPFMPFRVILVIE